MLSWQTSVKLKHLETEEPVCKANSFAIFTTSSHMFFLFSY